MTREIIILPGDGIGSEVVTQAVRVLDMIAKQSGVRFNYVYDIIGSSSRELTGSSLLKETLKRSRTADAILLGTLSQHAFDKMIGEDQDNGILKLRRSMGVFATLHVVTSFGGVATNKIYETGRLKNLDIQVYRDASDGNAIVNGEDTGDDSINERFHSQSDLLRLARPAFKSSANRRGRVHIVLQAGRRDNQAKWVEAMENLSREFPEVSVTYQTMEEVFELMTRQPEKYDVIITEHQIGNQLITRGAKLVGSEFIIPGADLGAVTSVFSPWHGPQPEMEGTNHANPFGMILTSALMLEHLGMQEQAEDVRNAVKQCLENGRVARDMDPEDGMDTDRLGEFVLAYLD